MLSGGRRRRQRKAQTRVNTQTLSAAPVSRQAPRRYSRHTLQKHAWELRVFTSRPPKLTKPWPALTQHLWSSFAQGWPTLAIIWSNLAADARKIRKKYSGDVFLHHFNALAAKFALKLANVGQHRSTFLQIWSNNWSVVGHCLPALAQFSQSHRLTSRGLFPKYLMRKLVRFSGDGRGGEYLFKSVFEYSAGAFPALPGTKFRPISA